jgi:hypothetical protein
MPEATSGLFRALSWPEAGRGQKKSKSHKAKAIEIFLAIRPFTLAWNSELLFLGGTIWLVLPLSHKKRDWQSFILLAQGSVNSKDFRATPLSHFLKGLAGHGLLSM